LKSKQESIESSRDEALQEWVNTDFMSDYKLSSADGQIISIHKGLIADRFKSEQDMNNFLN